MSASRFANLSGDQLAGEIAALEAAIDAEAEAWVAAGKPWRSGKVPVPAGLREQIRGWLAGNGYASRPWTT